MKASIEIAIVGDSYTTGSDMGGNGSANWTAVASAGLNRDDVRITVEAQTGAGYATAGIGGLTFHELTERAVGSDTDIAVIFGSRNDGPMAHDAVVAGASATYAVIRARAPHAQILVVGPPWTSENIPGSILGTRDGVRDTALAAGSAWVDPIAEGWFFGDDSALIGEDRVHPTDEGHAYMAERMLPHVLALLPAA